MFEGYDDNRLLAMTDRERRWLDNIKKAFHESDRALQSGRPEDRCLEELFKGIDTAKTLRRSLRGEDTSSRDNKKRFVEFLGLEIPAAQPGGSEIELLERDSGKMRKYTLGEIIYSIRCMVHENENLNVAEAVDYHILLDWSVRNPIAAAVVRDGTIVCNGYFIWNRLREILSKFITGIEGMIAFATNPRSFSVSIEPDIGSIIPIRRARE
jgi:hypothetical protein